MLEVPIAPNLQILTCLLCRGEMRPYRELHPPYRLQRCPTCELIATWPRLSAEEIRQNYETAYEQNTFSPFPLQLRRRSEVLSRIMRHVSMGAMLEIGCAGGHFLTYARDRGWKVTGVELNREMAEYARANFQLDVLSLSVEDLPGPLQDQRFNVVYMSHVLEHLLEPDHVLEKLRGLLAPDGALVLRVPNIDALLFHLLGKHYVELYPDVHLFHYTRGSLYQLLAQEGFTIVDLRTRKCDFAHEGFILAKGILDAVGVYKRVRPSRDAQTKEARNLRSIARTLLAPFYAVTFPAWTLSSWLGLGYELFAIAKSKSP